MSSGRPARRRQSAGSGGDPGGRGQLLEELEHRCISLLTTLRWRGPRIIATGGDAPRRPRRTRPRRRRPQRWIGNTGPRPGTIPGVTRDGTASRDSRYAGVAVTRPRSACLAPVSPRTSDLAGPNSGVPAGSPAFPVSSPRLSHI